MTLSQELLDILVCPQCKGTLLYQQDNNRLICQSCRLAYPVRDGIPVLLVDEAEPVPES
jgi:uncharacterized protein YbaR (Trm112 family)